MMRRVSSGVKALLAGALAAFAVAACGSVARPTPPPPVVILESDFVQAVRQVEVTPGQEVDLLLSDRRPVPGSSLIWTARTADPAILAFVREQRTAAAPGRDGTYMAVFVAKALGTTRILIAGATSCEAMPKANCPDRSAQIGVTVS